MKLGEAEQRLVAQLTSLYDESESANISRLVLEACTGIPLSRLSLERSAVLSEETQATLEAHLQRLLRHEPVQYVLQKAWFYGMELYVDRSVLIPRPETEELVEWAVRDLKGSDANLFTKAPTDADATRQLKMLDIGTGSGCIALALKKAVPRAEVWGCDASEEALNVARRNAAALDIRVDFQGVNFLDEAQQKFLPTVDCILSNPPYIARAEAAQMRANVLDYEPHSALFVPDTDALVFYRSIARFARKRLYPGGFIYLELNEALATETQALFEEEGYTNTTLRKDMQGKNRLLRVRKSTAD